MDLRVGSGKEPLIIIIIIIDIIKKVGRPSVMITLLAALPEGCNISVIQIIIIIISAVIRW